MKKKISLFQESSRTLRILKSKISSNLNLCRGSFLSLLLTQSLSPQRFGITWMTRVVIKGRLQASRWIIGTHSCFLIHSIRCRSRIAMCLWVYLRCRGIMISSMILRSGRLDRCHTPSGTSYITHRWTSRISRIRIKVIFNQIQSIRPNPTWTLCLRDRTCTQWCHRWWCSSKTQWTIQGIRIIKLTRIGISDLWGWNKTTARLYYDDIILYN